MKIKKLSSSLIDKIAAGEVVERPASVVKELVENALDAHATLVEVEIDSGGKEKIVVRDNGVGMSKDDAKMAFQRHATSKIDSLDDLTAIETLGFRGEALSSIAAVSKITLKTKEEGEVQGTKLVIEGGGKKEIAACAHPQGSSFVIRDLFYNTPARQKFLKTTQTEFRHIRDWLEAQALAYPGVAFSLEHNGREIFCYSENQSQEERIKAVLGTSLEKYIPLEYQGMYFKLRGFVGSPELARKRKKNQYLFINGRYLGNKTVWAAVRKAYEELLPSSLYPPFVLYVDVRRDLLDVNVHPRKEEIKFINSSEVFDGVMRAIRTALSKRLDKEGPDFKQRAEGVLRRAKKISGGYSGSTPFSYREYRKKKVSHGQVAEARSFLEQIERAEDKTETVPILQTGALFLVTVEDNGVLLVDQHAADERILLERFMEEYRKERTEGAGQELLIPEKIELDSEDLNLLRKHLNILQKLGFSIDILENTIKISSVPLVLKDRPIEQVLLGFLDELSNPREDFRELEDIPVDGETFHTLATLACRAAVKKGDRLGDRERRHIVEEIRELGTRGATCPHGRPTWLRLTLPELKTMFHRP